MRGNLKAVGVVAVAVFALGAVGAQGALAAVEHEFHSDGAKTVATGANEITVEKEGKTVKETSIHQFTIGSAGTVKCNIVQGEATNTSTEVSAGTFKSDQLTATFHLSECLFGGNPATWNGEHCAFVFDSDTTTGNTTGGEHANVEIECTEGSSIRIATSVCTITIGPQEVQDAFRYENDKHSAKAIVLVATAHNVIVGNLNDKAGCALLPKGAIGKYVGSATGACYKDEGSQALEGTEKTTPTEKTVEGAETDCKVSNL